jgi:uncharacterized protein Smg (DUF494 family)
MQERIVEILVYLMSQFQQNRKRIPLRNLSKHLIEQGYTESEINSALSWLFDKVKTENEETISEDKKISENSHRVLNDAEKMVISTKAYGYLLQLRNLRLIDDFGLEQIIDRAMMLGIDTVGEEDIKSIAAAVIFSVDNTNIKTNYYLPVKSDIIH